MVNIFGLHSALPFSDVNENKLREVYQYGTLNKVCICSEETGKEIDKVSRAYGIEVFYVLREHVPPGYAYFVDREVWEQWQT